MTSENLGEFLTGDRIETSPYSIYMQHNISCSALCRVGAFPLSWLLRLVVRAKMAELPLAWKVFVTAVKFGALRKSHLERGLYFSHGVV